MKSIETIVIYVFVTRKSLFTFVKSIRRSGRTAAVIVFLVMKERIRKIMELAHLSQQDFADRLGMSPASLSGIFNGRTNPTNNHVQAIHRAFPQINVSWLMFGEGDMFVPSSDGEEHSPFSETQSGDDENFKGTLTDSTSLDAGGKAGGGMLYKQGVLMDKDEDSPEVGSRGAAEGLRESSRPTENPLKGGNSLLRGDRAERRGAVDVERRAGDGRMAYGSNFQHGRNGMSGCVRAGSAYAGREVRENGRFVDNVNIIDRPPRKIKEIRVFYDDGTYEAFVPSSK